jgi:hypothetical protein
MLSHLKPKKNILQNTKIKVSATSRSKIALCIIFFLILPISSCTTFSLIFSSLKEINGSSNPTSIPWIDNQAECLHTHRIWQDNKCWDYEHSSIF